MMIPLGLPDDATEIPKYEAAENRHRLSLTSDVLDFRKCRRKYGLYKVRGFSDSSQTSEFVGTFAHRGMEEAWQLARETGGPPSVKVMISKLERVREDLKAEGRSPHSWPAVFHAGYQVLRMTETMAERGIFERVIDTERTLRYGGTDFVLEGVADMILDDEEGAILWDFKSARDPRRAFIQSDVAPREKRASRKRIRDYSLQLRLYHHLCEQVMGVKPAKCELIFLGEFGRSKTDSNQYEDLEAAWRATDPTPMADSRWRAQRDRAGSDSEYGVFYSVPNDPEHVEAAVSEFEETAADIISCLETDTWVAPSQDDLPSKQTCDDCDFLESCEPAMRKRES